MKLTAYHQNTQKQGKRNLGRHRRDKTTNCCALQLLIRSALRQELAALRGVRCVPLHAEP